MDAEGLTRREALALGLVGAAALTLSACSDGASPSATTATTTARPDGASARRVVVVGAGLAGLTAALDLVDAGWDVVVLEARSRVGGRVHTVRRPFSDGVHAEAGGESIDDDHDRLLAMLRRFHIPTEQRPPDKILQGLTSWHGTRAKTSRFVAGRGGKVAADYERFYDALDDLSADVDPVHPERLPGAEQHDARSLAEFTDDLHLVPEARFLVDTDNRGEFNAEPHEVSLLFAMQQAAVGESVEDSSIESMRVKGGNDRLPRAMAAALGDRVRLERPVTRVEHRASGVRVTAGSTTIDAAWLVLACPLTPLREVIFDPPLPASVAATVAGLDLGHAAKVTLEYDERFWEQQDLSGFTVTDLPFGIAWSPTDSYASTPGLLTAFITGDGARAAARQSDRERVAAVRSQFAEVYPGSTPLLTGNQATTAWANERFTGGGYAVHQPGQFLRFWPVLRAGTGRIRFAGEHTETLAGYMESAVRSGHRVARELGAPR